MVLAFSSLYNVWSIASISNVGTEIHSLEAKRASIKKQNDDLELTISQSRSLSQLKAYAMTNGFVPIQSIQAIQAKDTKLAMQP